MISYKTFDIASMVDNILAILDKATTEEISDGRQWYQNCNLFARQLSRKHDLTFATVAGIIAALSPETHWSQNVIDTEALILQPDTASVTTYGRNRDKAVDFLDGRLCPINHYTSRKYGWRKCSAFFSNIVKPATAGRVTLDRHAARIAHGYYLTGDEVLYYVNTPQKYRHTEAAFIKAADIAGIQLPHVLQAITWLTYRRLFVKKKRQDIDLSSIDIYL